MTVRTPVYKHVFRLVVLTEAESANYSDDLYALAYAISEGEDIGQCCHESVERIEDGDRIVRELLDVGNDGTFFDEWDAEP
jgi:hypothetical protein